MPAGTIPAFLPPMLQSTFTQKLIMALIAGFAAACLLYLFRHVVQQAFWESSGEGWKKSLYQNSTPPPSFR